jgi:hypothetical protein
MIHKHYKNYKRWVDGDLSLFMNIISASRRTDLPACFPEQTVWKIIEMNRKKPIDAVVFWTKNAQPIIPYLNYLTNIPFYFQYTLNTYNKTWEPGIPDLYTRLGTFKQLSDLIGPDRVIWRYDPIFITNDISIEDHINAIDKLSMILWKYTHKLVFSFFDAYPKLCNINATPPNLQEQEMLFAYLESLTKKIQQPFEIATCAELYGEYKGIKPNKCIDPDLLIKLGAKNITNIKDYGQRQTCGCIKSTDIGKYHTCKHGCKYCYAK